MSYLDILPTKVVVDSTNTELPQRQKIKITGATITDDPANGWTLVAVSGGGGGGGTLCTTAAQGEVNQLSGTDTVLTNPSGADGGVWAKISEANITTGTITNASINASAGIAKTKLAALDVVNADVNASAAIAQSKLALDITNAEVNASAAIAQSKLALDITDSEINASAAIVVSKLSGGTDGYYLVTSGSTPIWAALPTIPSALDDLSDVTLTSPATGQPLAHNGSVFVNLTGLYFANGEIRVGTHVTTPTGVGIHLASGEVITYEETSGAQRELIGMDGSHPFIGDDLGTRLFLRTKSSGYFQFEFAGAARYKLDSDYLQLINASIPVAASGSARLYSYLGKPSVAAGGGAVHDLAPLGTDDGTLTADKVELYSDARVLAGSTSFTNTGIDIAIADGELIVLETEFIAFDAVAGDVWERKEVVRLIRSGASVIAGTEKTIYEEKDDATWDFNADATTTVGTITLQVKGDATNDTTFRVHAKVRRPG